MKNLFNEQINQLIKCLQKDKKVKAAYFVGSYLYCKEFKDIDFLIIYNEAIKNLVVKIKSSLPVDNINFCDDSFSFIYSGQKYNLAVFSEDRIKTLLKSISSGWLYGECREWCLGYWMPEAFLFDLKNAKKIFDKKDTITGILKNLNYDTVLSDICNRINKEITLRDEMSCENFFTSLNETFLNLAILRLINIKSKWCLSNFKKIKEKTLQLEKEEIFKILKEIKTSVVLSFLKEIEYDSK